MAVVLRSVARDLSTKLNGPSFWEMDTPRVLQGRQAVMLRSRFDVLSLPLELCGSMSSSSS